MFDLIKGCIVFTIKDSLLLAGTITENKTLDVLLS